MNSKKPDFSVAYVVFGCFSLLIGSYFDNIRGPLLTQILNDLGLDLGDAGLFLATGQIAAALAALSLLHLQAKVSDRMIMTGLFCIAGGAGMFASLVSNFAQFLLLALALGAAISTLGVMSNVLVIHGTLGREQGRFLTGLHGMFGLGSLIATLVVGLVLKKSGHWSSPFLMVVPFCALGALFSFRFLNRTQVPYANHNIAAPFKFEKIYALVLAIFATYVAGEVGVSMWMATFLTKSRQIAPEDAAFFTTLYFLVMTVSRLSCSFFLRKSFEIPVAICAISVPVGVFILGYYGPLWVLPLMGLYGPFFPIVLSRVSRTFRQVWRVLTTLIMVALNLFGSFSSFVLGRLGDNFGIEKAYLLAPLMLMVTLGLFLVYLRFESGHSTYPSAGQDERMT